MNIQDEELVSIIIPVFNRETLVKKTIISCLKQTYRNFEIICVDDHSTDRSIDVIKEIALEDPRIQILRNTRTKGVSGARNCGIEKSKGNFIAFIDSDDQYEPHHLESIMNEFQEHPQVDWIYADFCRVKGSSLVVESVFKSNSVLDNLTTYKEGNLHIIDKKSQLLEHIKFEKAPGLHTSIVRRYIFRTLCFDESLQMFEDWKLRYDAILAGYALAFINRINHKYFIHDNNLCSSSDNKDYIKKLRQIDEIVKLHKSIHSTDYSDKGIHQALKKHISRFIFWECGYNIYKMGKPLLGIRKMFLGLSYDPASTELIRGLISVIFTIAKSSFKDRF
ncbi:glycosyltransferase family 2 protein [Acidihalobacter aeolianus]|uniref:glycosyltransferase family 2 protein n=1 Tax=Acidihalobacter aeolianus TaxID=2792603 RepID=UPI0009F340DC|nr:glycosyltransferase family 2 protein [Acidihalobacter aeolianus]